MNRKHIKINTALYIIKKESQTSSTEKKYEQIIKQKG